MRVVLLDSIEWCLCFIKSNVSPSNNNNLHFFSRWFSLYRFNDSHFVDFRTLEAIDELQCLKKSREKRRLTSIVDLFGVLSLHLNFWQAEDPKQNKIGQIPNSGKKTKFCFQISNRSGLKIMDLEFQNIFSLPIRNWVVACSDGTISVPRGRCFCEVLWRQQHALTSSTAMKNGSENL